MAETLGSLCDKLTIIKLKQWHTDDAERAKSLGQQERQILEEIDDFIGRAVRGAIPAERLTFEANKVYKVDGNAVPEVKGTLGEMVSQLAVVNCTLWHEQEKVYDFDAVPEPQRGGVVKQLAQLNLRRNRCIDDIDRVFRAMIESPAKQ